MGFERAAEGNDRPTTSDRFLATAKEVTGILALLSALFYGIARLVLDAFYAPFAVDPEDVGWDTTTVLTKMALPWSVLLLTGFFVLWTAFQELSVLQRIVGRIARVNLMGPLLVVTLVLSPLIAPFAVAAEDFQRSQERLLAGSEVSGGTGVDLLPVEVRCVVISPLASDESISLPSGPLQRLGVTGSQAVLRGTSDSDPGTMLVSTSAVVQSEATCPGDPKTSPPPYHLRRPILAVVVLVGTIAMLVQIYRRAIEPQTDRWLRAAIAHVVRSNPPQVRHTAVRGSILPGEAVSLIVRWFEETPDLVVDVERPAEDCAVLEVKRKSRPATRHVMVRVLAYVDDEWLIVDERINVLTPDLSLGIPGQRFVRWYSRALGGPIPLPDLRSAADGTLRPGDPPALVL